MPSEVVRGGFLLVNEGREIYTTASAIGVHRRTQFMSDSAFHHIQARVEQGVLVLTLTDVQLHGDALAGDLRHEIMTAVEQFGVNRIVIDFSPVHYVSSVAFRPLLSLRRRLQTNNGRMILCGMSELVAEVFQTTRLISTSRSIPAPFEAVADAATAVQTLVGP
jgi:anti-anti-sigma factor